jgi:hypothetical protein
VVIGFEFNEQEDDRGMRWGLLNLLDLGYLLFCFFLGDLMRCLNKMTQFKAFKKNPSSLSKYKLEGFFVK